MENEAVAPSLSPEALDRVQATLEAGGPIAAVDQLCEELRTADDLQALFYALLMKKRVELGVSPFPTGPALDLPPETHEAYEGAIREAGRQIGGIYLERRQFARAWGFFRMLGEPEPVRQALAQYQPGEDEDTYAVVDIAWQQGVMPEKGFDIILERHGICSAITMVGSADLSQNPDLKLYCVKRLVRALHGQLLERLRADLAGNGRAVNPSDSITAILDGQPDLFADDLYHIDVSHLQSVVHMAVELPPGPELDLAIELCMYGAKLSPALRGESPPPFETGYADYRIYLEILAGRNVEAGLTHFRAKLIEAVKFQDPQPAEVLVNLLIKLDRLPDALAVAREHLAGIESRELACPSVTELARRAKNYVVLAEAAKLAGDPVNFLAGLIANRPA